MTDETIIEQDERADAPEGAPSSVGIPPYIPFKTLLTFFGELKTNGLPPQIDGSVLRRFSFGTQGQLKSGLRYLGLLDGAKPTPALAELVDAYQGPDFSGLLLKLLKDRYPFVFELDLLTATPTMFADAFKVTGAKEEVSRKCRTFFLHAAKEAKLPLGPRMTAGATTRAPSGTRQRARAKSAKAPEEGQGAAQGERRTQDQKPDQSNVFMDKLLSKFPEFDPNWPDDIKSKWFANFDTFMKVAKTK